MRSILLGNVSQSLNKKGRILSSVSLVTFFFLMQATQFVILFSFLQVVVTWLIAFADGQPGESLVSTHNKASISCCDRMSFMH